MLQFVLLLCMFILTGVSIYNIILEKKTLSGFLIYPLLLGVSFHTILFIIFAFFNIFYSITLFSISTLVLSLLFISKSFRIRLINVSNDLKNIPFYYVLFIILVLFRLFIYIATSSFDYFNWDELSGYQYLSKVIFIDHDFSSIFKITASVNYLIGTLSYSLSDFTLFIPRLFVPLFFIIISIYIYASLNKNKVNKNISALLSMLFLISSSEYLIIAKTFYTNIFFSAYFAIGLFSIVDHYFIKKSNDIPFLGYIVFFSTMLTRGEGIYLVAAITFLINMIVIFSKRMKFKNFMIITFVPIIYYILWNIGLKLSNTFNAVGIGEATSKIDLVFEKLKIENLTGYIEQAYRQTFKFDYYFFNYLIFIVFAVSIVFTLINLFSKKIDKKKIAVASTIILVSQFVYIGLVIATQLLLFTVNEFKIAASTSRYIISVLPISFISVGLLLFYNTAKGGLNMSKERKLDKVKNPKVLMIIPAYNEEENILNTYNSIIEYNNKNNSNYDVLVINDCSTDKTAEICRKNGIPTVNLFHNLGIGGAVQTGYKYAAANNYDIAIQFDGDGQHDVAYVKNLIKPIIEGQADFVIGSRFVDLDMENFKSTRARRLGIFIISFAIKLVTGKKIYDTTSGFRACDKAIIKSFAKYYPTEYPEPITTVELLKNGYLVEEVPAKMKERIGGVSSIRAFKNFYYMINVLLSIFALGFRREK